MLINLLGLMLRFREGIYPFVGDIKKMYHSIELSNLDQHIHRFLWRDLNLSIEPKTFVMTSVSFGDRPAGCNICCCFEEDCKNERREVSACIKLNID